MESEVTLPTLVPDSVQGTEVHARARTMIDAYFANYTHLFRETVKHMGFDSYDVENIVQDTYRLAVESIPTLQHCDGIPTWISTILKRVAVNATRHPAKQIRYINSVLYKEARAPRDKRKHMREKIDALLLKLDKTSSDILKDFYLEDRTIQEIANSRGLPEVRVGYLRKAAIGRLRKICERDNIGLHDFVEVETPHI